jgi:hypothetical protein
MDENSSITVKIWLELNDKIFKGSVNNEKVRRILKNNLEMKLSNKEIFTLVVNNMRELGLIVFHDSRYFRNG